jgi:hypothetical protein
VSLHAQVPQGCLLGLGLFRVFQDVRLLLVPALLVAAHAAASCVLVYTNQVRVQLR